MSAPNVPYSRYPARSRPIRPPRQPLSPWITRLALLTLTGLSLLFFSLLVLTSGYQFLHQHEIYPGVSTVLDVDLAGMTRQQAITALSQRFTYADEATFVFRYGNQTWQFSAADLGVRLDVEATVDAAFNAGRGGSWLDNLIEQMDMRANGYPVAPVITYNQTEAEQILTRIAEDTINRPTLDSTLTVRDGRAISTPSQIGRSVDIPVALAALRSQVMSLATRAEIMLIVEETPPVVWETDSAADRINLALSAPVKFTLTGDERGPWVAETSSIEEMLVINETRHEDGTLTYDVGLNLDQAREFLTGLAPELSVQPENARFVFDDETRQLEVIKNSVNGRVLDVENTLARFAEAVFAENPADRRIELVFQDFAPDVPDTATAAQLGITGLVIQKTTYYYGSTTARQHNIEVATSNFHGLVIPPGGIFSFNEWLGDVSVESGYEQGLIIVGNQTITGVGGGVCQVATTAFQTAFYGGYPIVERIEHAYRVGYYEQGEGPGLDATVYSPIVDFRFKNDTPYYLLIETYNNPGNATLTWKFYSTSMNRRVVKEGPVIRNQTSPPPPIYRANSALSPGQIRQVDYAVSGADVYVYRTVYQDEQIIIDREEFVSHYVPWASQFEVAPGDRRINQ